MIDKKINDYDDKGEAGVMEEITSLPNLQKAYVSATMARMAHITVKEPNASKLKS